MAARAILACLLAAALSWTARPAMAAELQSITDLYQAREHVERGKKHLEMNLWEQAEQEYWQAVARDYLNLEARQALGDIFRKKSEFARAIEQYQLVLSQQPDNADIQYLVSLSYFDDGKFEEARTAAQKALAMKPDMAKAENLVRLSESKQQEQSTELQLIHQKELEALGRYRQQQELEEGALIGNFVPGWRLIQTGRAGQAAPGYLLLGGTAGMLVAGYFLRGAGAEAYTQAGAARTLALHDHYASLGYDRYRAGGYLVNAALGIFALNLVDSYLLGGKIFGARSRVRPSLPERPRHQPY